jgi:hypothetical protein
MKDTLTLFPMIGRRQALGLIGTALAGVAAPATAWAGTALAVRLPELIQRSRTVVRGTPLDANCVWETVGDQRRIVTYTRIRFEEGVTGESVKDPELMVRTLGGQVGEIGQVVHGEATLKLEEACVLFVARSKDGIDRVTAMAQGHYPLAKDAKGAERLVVSRNLAELVKANGSAVQLLAGRAFDEAKLIIRGAAK